MKLKLGIAVAVCLGMAGNADALTIKVLSGRADLVSGGDALVKIGGLKTTKNLKVTAGGKPQKAFRKRAKGTVTGLPLGRSTIVARQGKQAAKLVVRNHPQGGPVFSGPQLKPWKCQESAKDAQCNQPAEFEYLYKSTGGSGFQAYDPENPPSDVATTTTDRGVKVPYIVRVETGYIDRDEYKIAALIQPGKRWTGARPQKQFNHKLLITHGASCGVDYQPGSAPEVTSGAAETALGRGWVTMSNALDNSGHNCNIAVQAESLVMTKEHLVEDYGTLRYTIGTGCSGGSLAIQWVANAYPGIYQGILPSCSFPDAWGTATQFLDYHQAIAYFQNPARWAPGIAWSPTQMAAVEGHLSIANSNVSDTAQFHVVVPTDACAGVTADERYEPTTNPGGVRCSIQDAAINIFGPRAPEVWSAQEKKIGRGFAGIPVDNIGVQYGLGSLQDGTITAAQFVDLNIKMGGLDAANISPTENRVAADRPALANAYRSGSINETNNLDRTAIIDCRGPDPGAFHDAYRAFAVRARLDREHGGHPNQLIWEGPVALLGDAQCEVNSFVDMDRWLAAVEKDKTGGSRAQKVARDKPKDLTDRCYSGAGQKLTDDICGQAVVATFETPRVVAGDAITTDTNKCQLKPLKRSDYGSVTLSDDQFAQLQKVFPTGVCDFSKAGVDQQGAIPWQTYQRANGDVIYGGRRLGKAPRSRAVRRRR